MKSIIKALLAASMLLPIAAQAQEQDRRERGEGRRGAAWGERAPRSAEVGVEAQVRTERPQWRESRPEPAAQPAPDRRQPQPQPQRSPGAWQRGSDDRNDGRNDGGNVRREWRQDDRQPRDPRDDGGRNRGDRRQPGDWRDGQRADPRAVYRQPDPVPPRRDWRDDGRRGWNDGRGGGWSRGWRGDQRYDWTRYREANRGAYRLPRYYAPPGWGYGYRRFSVGVSLSSILFGRSYWIDEPYDYRLPEAYGPYRWVRYYGDALLVDIRSGRVVDVVYDIFD